MDSFIPYLIVSRDKIVMSGSIKPGPSAKWKSLLTGPDSQSSLTSKTNVSTTIGRTMMDNAVNDYYAQTISSQFMTNTSEAELFDLSLTWKDKESESMLSSIIQKPKLVLNSDNFCAPNVHTYSVTPRKGKTSPDFSEMKSLNRTQGMWFNVSLSKKANKLQESLSEPMAKKPKVMMNRNNVCSLSITHSETINSSQKRERSPDFSETKVSNVNQSNFLNLSYSNKFEASAITLKPTVRKPELVVKNDTGNVHPVRTFNCSRKEVISPDFSETQLSNTSNWFNASFTQDVNKYDFLLKPNPIVKNPKLIIKRDTIHTHNVSASPVIASSSQKGISSPDFSHIKSMTQVDLFDISLLQKDQESDSSSKVTIEKPKLVHNACTEADVLQNCQQKNKNAPGTIDKINTSPHDSHSVFSSKEERDAIQNISDDDSISSPTFPLDVFARSTSESTIEETCSLPVKSLPEKIEQIRVQHAKMKEINAMQSKPEFSKDKTLISKEPFTKSISSQKFSSSVDANYQDLEYIETSPSHKVDQWLNNHLYKEAQTSSSPVDIELKIEDYDSQETRNSCLKNSMKIPDFNKENLDMSNIVETSSIETEDEVTIVYSSNQRKRQQLLENSEELEHQNSLRIIDVNTEKYDGRSCSKIGDPFNLGQKIIENVNVAEHQNTLKIIEVNTEKYDAIYFSETNDQCECTQNIKRQKLIEKENSEELEYERLIEDVNTEKDDALLAVGDQNTHMFIENFNTEKCDELAEERSSYRLIEDFNTEKCEEIHYPAIGDPFEIECSDSPEMKRESAAWTLVASNQSEVKDHDNSVKKNIKFKPGSLGARLLLELNKQKSATEIWNYEVTKASESQDSNTLADLFRERLDLTIVTFWGEYSHVVVKAVKTKSTLDEPESDNTVLLLLRTSDFPKQFRQKEGQNFSIFPPWNSQWIPQLGLSFLTNIRRIIFCSTTKSSIQEIRSDHTIPFDLHDEDFYMKLIGLEGGLMKNND